MDSSQMVNQLVNSHKSSKERFTKMHIHVPLPRHQYSPFSAFLLSTGYSASRVFVFLVLTMFTLYMMRQTALLIIFLTTNATLVLHPAFFHVHLNDY